MFSSVIPENCRILLVDDDPLDANIVRRKLSLSLEDNCNFTWVSSGDEAVTLSESTKFDVMLLDYYLGCETARDFMYRIPPSMREIAVVVLTGKNVDLADEMSFGLDVEFFLSKDEMNTDLLTRTIRYAIRNRELHNRLGAFARILAHDLRSPTNNMRGVLDLLKLDLQAIDDSSLSETIDKAKNECLRISGIIDDLHDFCASKDGTLRREYTDLNQVWDEVVTLLKGDIDERGGQVTRQDLPKVFADKGLLIHLFENLIENGLKYNRSEQPTVEISAGVNNDYIILRVTDNGIGVDKNQSELIFRPMERLHGLSEFKGTGMGLAICRTVVERHGGDIWVESGGEDCGSTFVVGLPTRLGAPLSKQLKSIKSL